MTKVKVLLVEDDAALGFATKYFLEHRDFEVVLATHADAAWKQFMKHNFDICLLDILLPGNRDGLELAKLIRNKNKKIPILMLSSKAKAEERIEGLENGADCYLTKPYNFEELLMRMQVFLKYASKKDTSDQTIFNIGGYEFNYNALTLGDDRYVHLLTQREASLLRHLFVNRGNVLKREDILMDLWGKNDHFLGRSLDVFIAKLRKYFRTQPDVEIQTIHGVGFKFVDSKPDISKTNLRLSLAL